MFLWFFDFLWVVIKIPVVRMEMEVMLMKTKEIRLLGTLFVRLGAASSDPTIPSHWQEKQPVRQTTGDGFDAGS